MFGISGDQIVSLVIFHLDASDIEGSCGLADQAKLWAQISWSFGPMRLIFRIEIIAEGFSGMIKNDGEVRWLFIAARFTEQLPQHIAKTLHSANGQAVALACKGWQGVIGAEDIARSINQIDMITLLQGGL